MYLIVFVDKEVSVCTRPYNFKYSAVHYNTTRMEKSLLYNTIAVSVLVGIISSTLHYTTLHYTTLHCTHGEEPLV